MNKVVWVLLLGAGAVAWWQWRGHEAPSPRDVESALRLYLASPESMPCAGSVNVDELSHVSIGKFASQFGAWPVYADFAQTCRVGVTTTRFQGSKDDAAAVAFARRSADGKVEVFIPQVFQDAKHSMQQSLSKAFDTMPLK